MSVLHNDSEALSLPSYRKNSTPPSVDISSISCRNYTITYIISGEATLIMPMEQLRLSAGDMLFLERGDYCIERHSCGPGVYRDITVEFGERELVNALSVIGCNGSLERAAHRCPRCDRQTALATNGARLSLYFDMLAIYMDGRFDFGNYTFRLLKLSELFCILLSLEEHVCIGGRLLRGVSDGSSIIDKTVKENILSNSSIKEMARNCGMGISAFKSEFMCRYGTSPHRWIVEQRLSHARFLLLSTTDSIAKISVQCRFSNPSHFIKQFKRHYGVTPRAFRISLSR